MNLEPCPFCNGPAVVDCKYSSESVADTIGCTRCGFVLIGRYVDDAPSCQAVDGPIAFKALAERWNHRGVQS